MDTFKSKYNHLNSYDNTQQREQYSRLKELVLSFNKDLEKEVAKAKDKYNLRIRGLISDKTGLDLSFTFKNEQKYTFDKTHVKKRNIRVDITDKVPNSLLEILKNFTDSQIKLLLHFRQMQSSIVEIEFQISQFNNFSEYHQNKTSIAELDLVLQHLKKLVNEVENSNILSAIQKLDPDVLGSYFLNDNHIELYWLSIGFLSLINNYSVEDYTLVVLIHELTHGYTHIGFDKDGNSWLTSDFGNSDLKVVEGFAQLYTEMICKDYFEGAFNAFMTLLQSQRTEYTDYKYWELSNGENIYERARLVLLKTRSKCWNNYGQFRSEL
jgi:hypothetical protein